MNCLTKSLFLLTFLKLIFQVVLTTYYKNLNEGDSSSSGQSRAIQTFIRGDRQGQPRHTSKSFTNNPKIMSMLSILRIIVYQNRIVVQDENRYIFNDNIKNIIITGEDAILKIFGNNLEIKNYLIGPKIMAKSVKIKINGLTRSINKLTADYDFTYTLGEGQKPTSKFCPTFKIEGNYYVEIHIEDINASILKLIEINSTKVDNQIIGKNNRDVTKFSKPLSDNLEIENHTSKWCNLM